METPFGSKLAIRRWRIVLVLAVGLAAWVPVRRLVRPRPPTPPPAALAQAKAVRILRDQWGVPHIFGKTDADAAFGLAYASAEDDWPTIQAVLAASTGRLGLLFLSKQALVSDYFANLIQTRAQAEEQYDEYSPAFRDVLESYARGLNHYAFLHPAEADGRLLPFSGKDIAASFALKIPIMVGLPKTLEALNGEPARHVGDSVATLRHARDQFPGSNAHAVSARRSSDGIARLNVNSHQPWEGPVAWYEAQVVSEQGWNMTGGTFPGAPLILHGHNDHLGWAHTVNAPDLIDVYELQMNPQRGHEHEYRFDGKWVALKERDARLEIDVGVFNIAVHKPAFESVHGPVLATSHGFYAVRYAGIGRSLRSAEQWFRMNKARSFEEWKAAMQLQGIPMFNTVYADKDNIYYVYNALLPIRSEAHDYTKVLPGDRSDALWGDYLPFQKLPQVENPPSGFVQSCNGTPFQSTAGDGNPRAEQFSPTSGIERSQNNRGLRSLALFGGSEKISREDFLRFKWDRTYAKESRMFTAVVRPLIAGFSPTSEAERQGIELLRSWDGKAEEDSRGAALAILTFKPLAMGYRSVDDDELSDPGEAFRRAVQFLMRHYRTVDVPLGKVQLLRRGNVDLPIGGGPDVLNAVYAKRVGDKYVGYQGDSYVLIAEFSPDGAQSRSIHQYGSSNRPRSPHYADQARLFVKGSLKPALRTIPDIRRNLEREYSP